VTASWFYWLAPILAAVVLLRWAFRRYGVSAIEQEWTELLNGEGQRKLDALELQAQADAAVANSSMKAAARARREHDFEEASRLLTLGYEALEAATPDRLTRLRGMAVCARMATAFLPMPALSPRQFHLRRLATLAGVAQLVDQLLLGPGQRFLLRLRLLRVAFPLALRAMSHARWRATADPHAAAAWAAFEAGITDWQTLDREHVESFRVLLASVARRALPDEAAERLH